MTDKEIRCAMTTPLPEERLREIAERESKATKGPWSDDSYNTVWDNQHRAMFSIADHPDDDGESYKSEQIAERSAWYNESENNKDFLCHARQDIPDLLAEVARLQAELAESQRKVTELEPRAAFGDNCWQDQCENAYVEYSVVERLKSLGRALLYKSKDGKYYLDSNSEAAIDAFAAAMQTEESRG